jgi:hypothetical protein
MAETLRHRTPVDHIGNRQFCDLAVPCAGMSSTARISAGTCRVSSSPRDGRGSRDEFVVEPVARRETDEQDDAGLLIPCLGDGDRLLDLVEAFHLPADRLCRSAPRTR